MSEYGFKAFAVLFQFPSEPRDPVLPIVQKPVHILFRNGIEAVRIGPAEDRKIRHLWKLWDHAQKNLRVAVFLLRLDLSGRAAC